MKKMARTGLVLCVSAVVCVSCLSGCKDSPSEQADEEIAKTAAEYAAEAEKEIGVENMADELAKIEQAIEDDIRAEEL